MSSHSVGIWRQAAADGMSVRNHNLQGILGTSNLVKLNKVCTSCVKGEEMTKEYNVTYVKDSVSRTCGRRTQERRSKLKESVTTDIDLILLHSCTFEFLVTELLSALDHSPNAFALTQDCSKIELDLSLSPSVSF